MAFLRSLPGPWVVKTDGLAAGKGVLVTDDLATAEADVASKLSGASFGAAGQRVVIEEGLSGPEVSVFAVCDGDRAAALDPAQDFKRVGDGDTGPNTGGMGAYSPLPWLAPTFAGQVIDEFIEPTLAELRRRGIDYRGALYAGFMLTPDGPKLLEYNIRFGDPDGQVVLMRLTSDLTALLASAAAGRVDHEPVHDDGAAVLVVAASEGYPTAPRTGDVIEGLDEARTVEGVNVLCAGVARDDRGALDDWRRTGAERGRPRPRPQHRPWTRLRRRRSSHLARLALPHRHSCVTHSRGGYFPMTYKVAILMGSPNDRDKMKPAEDTLAQFGVDADVRVLSAHRNPEQVTRLASSAREEGYSAFICAAGMAAHLAGVVAAHTSLPVVGVPIASGALNGVDALYSTVQMPKGIPVATVAIDGSMNAALLVIAMLAISDADLAGRLDDFRAEQAAR